MPYAGENWSNVSAGSEIALGIDLGPYIATGDALVGTTLTSALTLEGGTAPALPAAPYLVGTVANQVVKRPPAGFYILTFTCQTADGLIIELWSKFTSNPTPGTVSRPYRV